MCFWILRTKEAEPQHENNSSLRSKNLVSHELLLHFSLCLYLKYFKCLKRMLKRFEIGTWIVRFFVRLYERSNISGTLGFSVPTEPTSSTAQSWIQNLMPKASNFKFQGGWIVSGFWDAQTSTPTPTAPPPRDYGKRYFTADGFHQTVGSRMRRTNSIFYALG